MIRALVLAATDGEGTVSELEPWLDGYDFEEKRAVPGARDPVRITGDGLAVTATGIGKAAAAGTVTALFAELELSAAYVVSAGIAGAPPSVATPGAVYLADAVVDWDLKHRWDGDDGADSIGLLGFRPRDYVVRTDEALVAAAREVAAGVELADDEGARAYRERYGVDRGPFVDVGTTVCGDEFWHGAALAAAVEELLDAYGAGPYRTTESEDMGTATALGRFGALDRYLSVRGVSNFDRPAAGQTPRESLEGYRDAVGLGIENTYRVASAVVDDIVGDWERWRDGPPG